MGSTRHWVLRGRPVAMLLVLAGLLVLACDDQGPSADPDRSLEGKVNFSFHDFHDPLTDPDAPLVLHLVLRTETIHPCCNWGIVTEHTLRPTIGRVELQEIEVPMICLTVRGPAMAYLPWRFRNGTVPLQFVHGGVTDSYALQATDSTIAVSPAGGSLTTPDSLTFHWRRR